MFKKILLIVFSFCLFGTFMLSSCDNTPKENPRLLQMSQEFNKIRNWKTEIIALPSRQPHEKTTNLSDYCFFVYLVDDGINKIEGGLFRFEFNELCSYVSNVHQITNHDIKQTYYSNFMFAYGMALVLVQKRDFDRKSPPRGYGYYEEAIKTSGGLE